MKHFIKILDLIGYSKLEVVVRSGLLLSSTVGVIIFLLSFQLLGGVAGAPVPSVSVAGVMTPIDVFAGVMGLFGTVAGLFFTWLTNDNRQAHAKLFKGIDRLSNAVAILVEKSDKINASKKELMALQEDQCSLISEIDPSGKLEEFYQAKCKSFREFVAEMMELGFEGVSTESLMNNGKASAKAMRVIGENMLGAKFMDKFYDKHGSEAIEYLANIGRIIEDADNSVVDRVQERSVKFMKEFIKDLQATYIRHNKLV